MQHFDCKCHLLYQIWAADSPASAEWWATAGQPQRIIDNAATIVRMLMIRSLPFKVKRVAMIEFQTAKHFKPIHNHIITYDALHSGRKQWLVCPIHMLFIPRPNWIWIEIEFQIERKKFAISIADVVLIFCCYGCSQLNLKYKCSTKIVQNKCTKSKRNESLKHHTHTHTQSDKHTNGICTFGNSVPVLFCIWSPLNPFEWAAIAV